jgi:hypothetical protein
VPKEAHLRCRLQELHSRSRRIFVQPRLTKRSLEEAFYELRTSEFSGTSESSNFALWST